MLKFLIFVFPYILIGLAMLANRERYLRTGQYLFEGYKIISPMVLIVWALLLMAWVPLAFPQLILVCLIEAVVDFLLALEILFSK